MKMVSRWIFDPYVHLVTVTLAVVWVSAVFRGEEPLDESAEAIVCASCHGDHPSSPHCPILVSRNSE